MEKRRVLRARGYNTKVSYTDYAVKILLGSLMRKYFMMDGGGVVFDGGDCCCTIS